MEKKRILIVEDEEHIADGLKLNLTLQGYDTLVATDGVEALDLWKEWRPDLIVLDIMLPRIDGLSVLRNIRLEDQKIPILILSARGTQADRIEGLRHGVDDYLAKPFDLEEFLLRIERLLTRISMYESHDLSGSERLGPIARIYRFGNNEIDFLESTARCKYGQISLTEQEIKLLKLFVSNRGKALSRQKLLEIGWGYTKNMTTRTVDNFLVRFRKYFENDPKNPEYFKSRRSVGYIFDHD
ncbi:MAG: response regulator transcription factor [Proteobacteria bacterium]|nr:response regulator transcription factor [Pseudomonadota bacterium]